MKRSFEGEVMDSEVDKDLENLEQNVSFWMNSVDNVENSSDQYRSTSLKYLAGKQCLLKHQWYNHIRKANSEIALI